MVLRGLTFRNLAARELSPPSLCVNRSSPCDEDFAVSDKDRGSDFFHFDRLILVLTEALSLNYLPSTLCQM